MAFVNLYLVRHGQTSFSRENRFCGSSDPALTDVGQAMAEAFATAYAATTWDAIYEPDGPRATNGRRSSASQSDGNR